jgi:hypothetical protein
VAPRSPSKELVGVIHGLFNKKWRQIVQNNAKKR